MQIKEQLTLLIEGEHADTVAEARVLRREIIDNGDTVEAFLEAYKEFAGPVVLSATGEQQDLHLLMRSQGISLGAAKLLRSHILKSEKSVRDFLTCGNATSTVDLFNRAGDLIKLAGSKARAIQAVELFDELDPE